MTSAGASSSLSSRTRGAIAPAFVMATWFFAFSVARSFSTAAATTRILGTSSSRSLTSGAMAPASPMRRWFPKWMPLLFLAKFHKARAASSRNAGDSSCNRSIRGGTAPARAIAAWFSVCSDAKTRSMNAARNFCSCVPAFKCSNCPVNAGFSEAAATYEEEESPEAVAATEPTAADMASEPLPLSKPSGDDPKLCSWTPPLTGGGTWVGPVTTPRLPATAAEGVSPSFHRPHHKADAARRPTPTRSTTASRTATSGPFRPMRPAKSAAAPAPTSAPMTARSAPPQAHQRHTAAPSRHLAAASEAAPP
mmetsp:Transcript_129605/g.375364  ORF Transcript_129605/g.375364 Transcript_129605/m.375364 type:complete len:308 (-) Transcript_129605:435-1358(-)